MTALADVVGRGGAVNLSMGLDDAPLRIASDGKEGMGEASDDTLSFLLAPSSDTLRIMVDDSACPVEKGGLDFIEDSRAMYGACTWATKPE